METICTVLSSSSCPCETGEGGDPCLGVAEFFIIVRREEVMEGLMLVGLLGDLLPLPTIKENKMKVDFEVKVVRSAL